MKKITHTITCIMLVLFAGRMNAQLSGILTVPGTYTSIAAAITDLNTQGVNGAVTVNIAAGYTETAPFGGYVLNTIAGASAANQVTFQKNGAGANPLITAYTNGYNTPTSVTQDGVWRFVGTDWVTVDGISITDPNTVNPNTMEFGFGFFKASGTNGCQNNTIKNCVITLNRVNSVAGTGTSIEGSRGINVVNASVSNQILAITVTSAAGSNSNNKFYSNTIQNCHVGIAMIGFVDVAPFTFADKGNDFGGNSISTGNSVLNFGGGGTTQSEGVTALAQYNLNVSYNVINNNNGSGVPHVGQLKGIYNGAATSANVSINSNTITLITGNTTSGPRLIDNVGGSTSANNFVNINNNLLVDCVYGTTTSGAFDALFNTASSTTISISGNTLKNATINGATTASGGFIHNDGTGFVIDFNNNTVDGFKYTAATSGAFNFIYSNGADPTATLSISGNTVRNMTNSVTVSSSYGFILNNKPTKVMNFNNNIFDNLVLNTTNGVTFLDNAVVYANGSVQNVNGNGILGSFTKTGAGGTITFYTNSSSSVAGATLTNSNNNFSNINLTGATTIAGWVTTGTSGPTKIVTANTFTNITGGTSGITLINSNGNGNNTTISSNTISAITGGGAITGITMGTSGTSTLTTVSSNIISAVTSTGGAVTGIVAAGVSSNLNVTTNTISGISTAASLANGISITATGNSNIFKNRIYDMQANSAGGTVNGLTASAGNASNIFNNLIGDLRAPLATGANAVIGMNITGGTAMNVYFNSININASSSSATFGSSALFADGSAVLDLRNNILYNSSTSFAGGISAAFKRNTTSLTNYSVTSNNNLFYGGIPSANNVVFYDGTNSYLTLTALKAFLVNREQASVRENVQFVSTTGSNANFLSVNNTLGTLVESGATPIAFITDDYLSTTRNVTTPDIGAIESTYIPYSACTGTPPAVSAVTSSSMLCNNATAYIALPLSYTTTGLSYQWEQSITGTVGPFLTVPGATLSAFSTNVVYPNVYYRAVVTCSAGGSTTSTPVQVVAGPAVTPVAVAASTLICPGQNSALSLTNTVFPAGVVYQWQVSVAGAAGPYAAVTNASLASITASNITSNSWFQAIVSCSANASASVVSNPVTVNVGSPSLTPVTVAAATVVCPNSVSTLSLVGGTGPLGLIYQWQSSTSGAAGPYAAISTATNATYNATLTANTWYQAVISCSSSASSSVASTPTQVTIGSPSISPVTLANNTLVCPNGTSNLSLSGGTGPTGILNQWQFSTVGAAGPYTAISSATAAIYTATVAATAWYQSVISCTSNASFSVASTPIFITAGATTIVPTAVAATTTLCPNATSVLSLTPNGTVPAGLSYQWQISTAGVGGPYTNISGATATPYTATVAANAWYQAIVSCTSSASSSIISTPAQVVVGSPTIIPVTAVTNPSICSGAAAALSLVNGTAPTGAVYQWQVSTSGVSGPYSAVSNATNSTLSATNVTTNSWYQAAISCTANAGFSVVSTPALVNMTSPLLNPIAVAASSTVCPSLTSAISLNNNTGFSGVIQQWYASPTGAPGSYTAISTATNAAYTATIAATTWYQAVVSCSVSPSSSVASTPVMVTAGIPSLTPVSTAASSVVCPNSVSALTLNGATGPSGLGYLWLSSTTGSAGAYSAIPNATTTLYSATVTANTWYQGVVTCSATPSNSLAALPILVSNGLPAFSAINAVSASTSFCTGSQTVNLSLSGTLGSNLVYQWMASSTASNSGFASITNATLSTLANTVGTLGGNWYQATISCSTAPAFSISSNPVSVVLGTTPTATISLVSNTVCSNSTFTLSGSSDIATAYNWTGPTSYTSNVQNPVLINAAAGVYSLVTKAGFCSSTPSGFTLTTLGLSALSGYSILSSSTAICAGGTVSLTTSGAKVSQYSFTSSTGTSLIPFTSGSVTIMGSSGSDLPAASLSNIGFAFNFNGVDYTQFNASPDGWMKLGSTGASQFTNLVASTINIPKIYAAWDDMTTGTNGYIRMQTFGTAPNRYTVIEWFVTIGNTIGSAAASTFQVILYETTNAIEFRYGTLTGSFVSSSAGLTADATTFQSITYNGNTTSNTTANNSNTTPPASGTSYMFTIPPVTYSWSPVASSASSVVVTPPASGIYSLDITSQGCVATKTIALAVISAPTVGLIASNTNICPGSSATLTASGAATYSWSNGSTNTVIIVSPSATTTYTLEGKNGTCGTSTETIGINPIPTPSVTIGGSSGICTGQTATLTASGATTYTWNTGATTSSVFDSPVTNGTFTFGVVGTDGFGCIAGANQVLNVSAGLNIQITGPSAICNGQSANLNATGGVTYIWSTGETTSAVSYTPVTMTTYSVVGSSGTCSNSAVKTITVNSNPVVTIAGSPTICSGRSTTYTAGGASTYSWSTGPVTPTAAVAPINNITYTVTGTNTLGCSTSTVLSIVTNSLPILTVAQSATAACALVPVTFTASGAITYTWTGGPATATNTVSPAAQGNYTVSGSDAIGCIGTKTVALVTYSLPPVVIAPATPTICASTTLILTASGASTYVWSGGPATNTYVVNPATLTTYSVTGTNTNNCVFTKTVTVVTNTLPLMSVVPASATVCAFSTTSFTASGASSYTWSNPGASTTATVSVTPAINTVYTVTGNNAANCISTVTVPVTALVLPSVTIAPVNVCPDISTTFTASGANTYTWVGSASTGSTAAFTTTAPTAYSLSATGVNGCTIATQSNVYLYPLPIVSIASSTLNICALSTVTYTANGADTYTWNTNATGSVLTVNPAGAVIYTVTGTNTLTGCVDTETITVLVEPLPVVTITPPSTVVCKNSSLFLAASGAVLYKWAHNNSPNTTVNVTPSVTTVYTVSGTDAAGCVGVANATITVNPLPVIAITPGPTTICPNASVSFTASGAVSYSWIPGTTTTAELNVTPTAPTGYTVIGTDANNCIGKAYVGVDIAECTGIKTNVFSGNAVSLYPNPSSGVFTAKFDFEGNKTITITNSVGQLINQTTTAATSESFDLSGLSKGVYFVKVSTKEASGNYKIIIE